MKRNILFAFLTIFILLGSTSAVMADSGRLVNETTVQLNESGTKVDYEFFCIDEKRQITIGDKVSTTKNITTRDGVIEFIVDNYHNSTNRTQFQEDIWKISENTSIPMKTYPDNFTAQKILESEKVVTIEEINGSNYTVTRWNTETWDYLFRMTGDGWGKGKQDLLLFTVDYLNKLNEVFELIVPEEPEIPTNDTNETPINPEEPITPIDPEEPIVIPEDIVIENGIYNDVSSIETEKVVEKGKAAMKETGMPIIAVLFVLILSGIGIYRKR